MAAIFFLQFNAITKRCVYVRARLADRKQNIPSVGFQVFSTLNKFLSPILEFVEGREISKMSEDTTVRLNYKNYEFEVTVDLETSKKINSGKNFNSLLPN